MYQKYTLLFVLFLVMLIGRIGSVGATHIRAGEITAVQVSSTTYIFTLTIYGNSASPVKDDFALIDFGDGTTQNVYFNNSEVSLNTNTYRRTYEVMKTFSGGGTYRISYTQENRNENIKNMTISVNTPFYVETYIGISAFLGTNNPVQLSIPPIDRATVGELFVHNAGAYDPDGDSISYKMVVPSKSAGVPVDGYTTPLASNSFSLNPLTGDLVWDTPTEVGLYNVAFIIEEWRKGADGTYSRISYVTRDMQIEVLNTTNNPPVVIIPDDTCVVAGALLEKVIRATDPDGHSINLTAYPSTYFTITNPQSTPASGDFSWQTQCAEVRGQPYTFVFRAEDIVGGNNLSNYKTWSIKVNGPPPTGLAAISVGTSISLSWNAYLCANAEKMEIYRLSCDSLSVIPKPCSSGLTDYPGYVKIGEVPILTTTFIDNNNGLGLNRGINYCYLIVAKFSLPDGGESYPSLQSCSSLLIDVPVITNVSVLSTSLSGTILVDWLAPVEASFGGPYTYNVYRANGMTGNLFTQIASGVLPPYSDIGINTIDSAYRYKIELVGGANSDAASSVYLTNIPSNKSLTLNWNRNVPWKDDSVYVYRSINGSTYNQIATLYGNPKTYFDNQGLENCDTACYRLQIFSSYCNVKLPAIVWDNFSQESCGTPVDTITPIAPVLVVTGCEGNREVFSNVLDWTEVGDPNCSNLSHYNVYFSAYESTEEMIKIGQTNITTTDYLYTNYQSTAGCFSVSAVNLKGAEGEKSNKVCVDDCVYYELPNLVTPNNDSLNDFFRPFPIPRGVELVRFSVYNRWGALVYSVSDNILINWDSKDKNGITVTDGIYYYSATVHYTRRKNKEDEIQILKGWVQVLNNDGLHKAD